MIKELDISNVDKVINLGLKLNNNYSNLYDYESLNSGVNKTYIILDNNNVIGFIHIQDLIDEVDIIDIVIDEEYRRKGYGKNLINYIFDFYKDKKVILEVSADNEAAVNLYRSFDFNVINVRKGYYNGKDALVMEKKW